MTSALFSEIQPTPHEANCYFYHTIKLPSGLKVGPWDLRGREGEYLGKISVSGKSVIEFGPASGFFTDYLEQNGAVVTCFETAPDIGVDILPHFENDVDEYQQRGRNFLGLVRNSWWRVFHEKALKAKIAYGNIYATPSCLGQFDIAFLGALLLHCRDPLSVLNQACNVAKETVIVTDMLVADMASAEDSIIRFNPSGGKLNTVYWWNLSPGFVANYLRLRGFGNIEVSFHVQQHHPLGKMDDPAVESPMFTVVGCR